jgi:hypothetical protein
MDFKFLIIIALISLITLYFMNEFKILKNTINNNNENTNKLIKNKFHTFSGEIKELNTDLVNQTKKINKIHSQKITSVSNYFTESENDNQKNILNYLSESKDFKIDLNTEKINDDDIISNTSEMNTDDIKNLNYDVRCSPVFNPVSNKYDTSNKSKDDESKHDEIKSKHDESKHDESKHDESKHDESKHDDNISLSSNSNKSNSNKSNSNKSNSNKSNSNKSNSNKSNSNKSNSNSISNKNNEQSEFRQYVNKSNGEFKSGTTENKIKSNLNEQSENIDTISIQSKTKSFYDKISFGSSKLKGIVPKLIIGTDINSDKLDENFKLEDIDNYKFNELKEIANKLNINNFYIDNDKKRKLYKKEELYLIIKEKLNLI